MITDKDITKLKKTFVTKDEMKEAFDKNTGIIVRDIQTVIEMVGEVSEKLDRNNKEIKEINNIVDDHERQIDRLNDKVFPTA